MGIKVFSQQDKACGNQSDGFWLMQCICRANGGSTLQHPSAHFLWLKEILVHPKAFEEELLHLQIVCHQLRDNGVKSNPQKRASA